MISEFSAIIRLLLSFVLGSLIGVEREKKGRSAGLRTHILVSLGSTLIMLISLYMYHQYGAATSIDPVRIAAGVVTGIGFLGAGAIIRSSERNRGLTTAASIWVSAAIGLAVGCGYILIAVVASLIVFLTLAPLKRLEKKLDAQRKK